MKTLSELFVHCLRDMYYAEKVITKELPKMISKTSDEDLKSAFQDHLEETKEHVTRLEVIFEKLWLTVKAEKCPAIEWIMEEARETMEKIESNELMDIALIWSAQKVEHYEIGNYCTLIDYAEALGHNEIADILQETLDEEEWASESLEEMWSELYSTAL